MAPFLISEATCRMVAVETLITAIRPGADDPAVAYGPRLVQVRPTTRVVVKPEVPLTLLAL